MGMTPIYFRLMTETNYTNEASLDLLTEMVETGLRLRPDTSEDDWIAMVGGIKGTFDAPGMLRVKEGKLDREGWAHDAARSANLHFPRPYEGKK